MELKKICVLKPLKTFSSMTGEVYYEQILICIDDYPLGVVSVDNFHDRKNRDLYDRLIKGEETKVSVTFKVIS